MNLMRYDAAAIGNHEFDFGVENMARLFRKAEFPVVCANYDFTGTALEGLVKPYVVIRRNGLRIGVFGLSPELDGLVLAESCAGVKYKDPVKAANDVARLLKEKEKCDIVICLSHLGWDIMGLDDTGFYASDAQHRHCSGWPFAYVFRRVLSIRGILTAGKFPTTRTASTAYTWAR